VLVFMKKQDETLYGGGVGDSETEVVDVEKNDEE
jgi:hypothetical protein